MFHKAPLAIFASGSGSTAEATIHATQNGMLTEGEVGLVITNNPLAGVLQRVECLNKQYSLDIRTEVVNRTMYPRGAGEPGEQTLAESEAALRLIDEVGIEVVLLQGYMRKVRGDLLNSLGQKPGDTSVFDSFMLNNHPGPLPETQGTWGIHTQESVIRQGLGYSAITLHGVSEDYDMGHIFREQRVPVIDSHTPETLFDTVQLSEKLLVPGWINQYLQRKAVLDMTGTHAH